MDYMLLSCRLSKSKLLAITTGFASAFLFITDANAQRIERPGQGGQYRQVENQDSFLAQGDRDLPRGYGQMYNVQSGLPGQGSNNPGSMSGRFRKYVNGGEQGDEPNNMTGGGPAGRRPMEGRLQNLSEEQRQMLKGKMQNMSKEERMQFVQQMRQRRGGQFGGQGQGPARMRRPGQGGADGGMQQQPRARGGERSRGAVRQWASRKPLDLGPLNLTEKQKEKIQAMRQTNSSQARQINKEMRSKRLASKKCFLIHRLPVKASSKNSQNIVV